MTRIHGKGGMVYMGIASGAVASPVAFLSDWTINFTVDQPEVTSFGDANKIYVSGLPDASGDFSGFYDDATRQLYTAARDGVARNFYLYPNTQTDPNMYWFGAILPDFAIAGGIGAPISIKSTWKASTAVIKYDPTGGYA
jgi:hypothetical protein